MFKGTTRTYYLLKHFSEYNILCYEQHGFCSCRSCELQLINTVHDFVSCLNDGEQCDVLFLDFKKAFNKVPHLWLFDKSIIWYKRLYVIGIKGFLTNRFKQAVLVWITKKAILQRFYLVFHWAPLLFLLQCEWSSWLCLYYNRWFTVQHADCICLQEDLNLLYQWCVLLWLMDFNPIKSEFLWITNKKNPVVYQNDIGNCIIKQVSDSKYLGVTIDDGMNT